MQSCALVLGHQVLIKEHGIKVLKKEKGGIKEGERPKINAENNHNLHSGCDKLSDNVELDHNIRILERF